MSHEEQLSPHVLPFVAAFVAVLVFMALQDTAYLGAGGLYEYPTNVPYLHLALADQIRAGGQILPPLTGVATSVLYPFLLLPQIGLDWQGLLPLFWNMLGVVFAATLWGRILWQSGYGTSFIGLFFALFGPVALHIVGVGFTGTEHILHICASLMIVSGLVMFVDHGIIGKMLIFGVIFAPLLRAEGLILVVLTSVLVMAYRRIGAGLFLLVLGLGPTALITYALIATGFDPFAIPLSQGLSFPMDAAQLLPDLKARADAILTEPTALVLLAIIAIALLIFTMSPWRRPLLIVGVIAAVLHLLLGQFGGEGVLQFNGIYIVASLAVMTISAAIGRRILHIGIVAAMCYAGFTYTGAMIQDYPSAPRGISIANTEFARLVDENADMSIAMSNPTKLAWSTPGKVTLLSETVLAKPDNPEWTALGTFFVQDVEKEKDISALRIYAPRQSDPILYAEQFTKWASTLPDTTRFMTEGDGQ